MMWTRYVASAAALRDDKRARLPESGTVLNVVLERASWINKASPLRSGVADPVKGPRECYSILQPGMRLE